MQATTPFAIGTWQFARTGIQTALDLMRTGASALDAVEKGIRVVEDNPDVSSVGYGGAPNSEGVVELDAAIMYGPGHRYGAVAGLRDIREAISVARLVMERTPHCLLVGEGARQFAKAQGFQPTELLCKRELEKWKAWAENKERQASHDTVCILALDCCGNLCAGTSTSGLRYKLPGRVGDTPIAGSGLYCDNVVGAAAATGIGEFIMRYCMSFQIVDKMRCGCDPMSACQDTILNAAKQEPKMRDVMVGVIAIDRSGNWGAAATREGFSAVVGSADAVEIVTVAPI